MRRHNDIFVHLAGLAALRPLLLILGLIGGAVAIGGMTNLLAGPAAAADADPGTLRGGVLCGQQFAPVCAELRGRRITYSNACFARAAGARVVHEGACGQRRASGKDCTGKSDGSRADPAADPQCRSWTDGCNICRRARPGAPAACTRMACRNRAPARCLLRFGEKL